MLQASYALHLFSSNSRSVLAGKNRLPSTFPLIPYKIGLFFCFSIREPRGTKGSHAIRSGKNFLFLQNCYNFWEDAANLLHLFSVPHLVRGDQLQPCVAIQGPQEWVRHTVFTEIALHSFPDEL